MYCPACATALSDHAPSCSRCGLALSGTFWEAIRPGLQTLDGDVESAPEETGLVLEERYRVEQLVAHGGMGTVFRGTDTKLNRPIAVKFLASHLSGSEVFVRRFLREAQSMARLDHPNIVSVYSV